MFQVEMDGRLEDIGVLGVGRIEDFDAGCRRLRLRARRYCGGDRRKRH
jgi:hypothetical protein